MAEQPTADESYVYDHAGAPWRGGVMQEDWARDQLVLRLGRQMPNGQTQVLVRLDSQGALIRQEDQPQGAVNPDAVIRLPNDLARVLMEALVAHFGGVAVDARTLRRDYDAERARVDKMIDAMIRGAT